VCVGTWNELIKATKQHRKRHEYTPQS
jgi:hypothetical protein